MPPLSSRTSELDMLKSSFARLNQQYRAAEDKLNEYREKLRETRVELVSKDRSLDVAKRLLSRLGEEKKELTAQAEQGKALSRQLGAKLAVQPELSGLQAKLLKYKGKAAEAHMRLHEAETRAMLADEAGRHQAAEVAVLKKALGLRADLPSIAGYGGQAQLLQALAQSQEEGASLAAQVADGQRQASQLEGQVGHLHGELDRLVAVRLELEDQLQASQRDTAEALAGGAMSRQELEEAQAQLRRNAAHLDEVSAAKGRAEGEADALAAKARQLQERLQATEAAAQAQASTLKAELQATLERSEAHADNLKALHTQREAALGAQREHVRQQLLEAEARLSQSGRDHEVEVLRLQARAGALEASLEGSCLREVAQERDLGACRGELDRLHKAIADLQAELSAARAESAAHADRAAEATARLDAERRLTTQLRGHLDSASAREALREEQLGGECGRLRSELAAMQLANERAQGEVRLCNEQLLDAAAHRSASERHIEELHTTVHALTRSKTKLQGTMLEQLGLFKAKLGQVEQENLTLRAALAALDKRAQGLAAHRAMGSGAAGSPAGGMGPSRSPRPPFRGSRDSMSEASELYSDLG